MSPASSADWARSRSRDVPAEVPPCRGLHAVRAVAEVDGVEVALEDGPLRVAVLELDRHHRFAELALEVLLRPEHHRADVLLGDRRPALVEVAGLHVAGQRPHHAACVDAVVVEEPLVLDRDDRLRQARRHRVELHRVAVLDPVQRGEQGAVGPEHLRRRGLVLGQPEVRGVSASGRDERHGDQDAQHHGSPHAATLLPRSIATVLHGCARDARCGSVPRWPPWSSSCGS